MQQVGAQGFANAQPVDPRQYPVPIPRPIGTRALITVRHVWVLHRRQVLRAAATVVLLLFALGLWQVRDQIAAGGKTVTQMVQGEFAAAGFGIDSIKISGQVLTSDEDIATLLLLGAGNSTLTFDVEKARARLSWLRAVESVTVRKVYPNQIVVEIVEKQPVVRWRIDDTTYLIDANGARVGVDTGAFTELPLVVGHGAADDALVMIRTLDRHPELKQDLAALSRIGDRRWDLIYYTGLRVQLPEQGVAQALGQLDTYHRDYQLLDRDVALIDLRVAGVVALQPTVREDAEEDDEKTP